MAIDRCESTQQFLFSKTGTGRIKPVSRRKFSGTDKALKSAFPDVLIGKRLIDDALQRLDSVEQFAAMVIRLDEVTQDEEKQAARGKNEEPFGAAKILSNICEVETGFWGALEPGLLVSCFPDKTGSENLEIARNLQKKLKKKSRHTVTIGIAAYPTLAYEKSDIVENALKALDHASFFGPDSAVVFDEVSLNISSDNLYEQGNIQEAVEELKKALLLDPTNVNVHNSLGVCYSQQCKYDQAIDEFKAAIAADPQEHMGFYNLGLVHLLTEQHDQALEFFLKANEINSEIYEIAFQIGKLYLDSDENENSRVYLEQAAALNTESSAVHRYLGDCHLGGGRPDDAISSYKKAIKQNPLDAVSMSALGYLYNERGENPEIALMFCRESVELAPENGLFHYRLGRIYADHLRFDDALKEFEKAEKFGHNADSDIQETRNRLEKKSA